VSAATDARRPGPTATSTRGYLAHQLGQALTAHRERTGLSQRAQARALGVAGNTLRELEQGLANPTLGRIEDVAAALGLTVELRVRRARP
jgi:transcriptional regulator with XRE-family HTH domain